MIFNEQHSEIRRTVRRFVEADINPSVDLWEQEGIFPAHELYRKAGDLGLLGISRPVEYGGLGLDYSYQMQQFQEERLWCVLSMLKSYENCINWTIDSTRERRIFGKPVLENQYIHYQLAEMQAEVELLRSLAYDAVEKFVCSRPEPAPASSAN